MVIIFAVVIVLYLRFVPLDPLDDDVQSTKMENREGDDGEPSWIDRATSPGHMAGRGRQLI